MEESLFSLNNLRSMEVIDITEGKRLGLISDVKIDCDDNRILSIIIPGEKTSFFSKSEDIEIDWSDVYKVGIDVILIDSKGKNILDVQKYI
ncbi:YlmC/YmxH family sporulation protein [Clostridium sp. B9]|uniref:YlmC/YmxH family sporulation protein n=1 Tax=Clostridium sp. B9 TaxID=3423224 RepID=UPI003D2EB55D